MMSDSDSSVVEFYELLGLEAPTFSLTSFIDLDGSLSNAAGTLAMDNVTAAGTLAMDTNVVDAFSTAAAGPSAVVFPVIATDRVIDVGPSAVAFATTTTTTDDSFASLRSLLADAAAQASQAILALGRRPPTPLMRQEEPKLGARSS